MRVFDFAIRSRINEDQRIASQIAAATRSAVVVEAQQVWDWFRGRREEACQAGEGHAVLRMIERCIPPFDCTMVEFNTQREGFSNVGVVVTREALKEGFRVGAGVWWCDLQGFAKPLPGLINVCVSDDGVPDWESCRIKFDDDLDPSLHYAVDLNLMESLATALLSFRFMHARGVEVRDVTPQRHERRRAEREGKPAPVTYKTLEIGVMRRTLETEGNVASNGIAKAMHICRGHFADYTKGKGLFGKHKVEVFVPEHIKGRQERGRIVKEYAIGEERLIAGLGNSEAPADG